MAALLEHHDNLPDCYIRVTTLLGYFDHSLKQPDLRLGHYTRQITESVVIILSYL